jgi:prepilin-type N-terminal cleavage/methylation domain-containing protein
MKKSGFTLVEIMTVVAILGVLSIASFSVYTTWQNKSKVSLSRTIIVQALSEAKQRASSGSNDSNWGLKYETGKVILFSGSSYLGRDSSQDKNFDLPIGVTLKDLDEIVFYKFTGLPTNTITITIVYGNETEKISINSAGVFGN